jgi:cytochrome c peroxidase
MAIVNVGLNNNLFWDSRSQSVPQLVAEPILNHIEMGMENTDDLVNKLSKITYYKPLFQAAFGEKGITQEKISNAMSQFLTSIKSTNSKFDAGLSTNFANFTAAERKGKDIFMSARAKCSTCHAGVNLAAPDNNTNGIFLGNVTIDPTFAPVNGEYGSPEVKGTANIGLDMIYKDQGKESGKFKIPSLRNIALTAPYMHDGRFKTLTEVVNHYSDAVQPHTHLDQKFVGTNGGLHLSTEEKQALVAFLNTLTDNTMVNDPKFSSPFVTE